MSCSSDLAAASAHHPGEMRIGLLRAEILPRGAEHRLELAAAPAQRAEEAAAARRPPGTRWTWPAGRSATRSPRGTPARGRSARPRCRCSARGTRPRWTPSTPRRGRRPARRPRRRRRGGPVSCAGRPSGGGGAAAGGAHPQSSRSSVRHGSRPVKYRGRGCPETPQRAGIRSVASVGHLVVDGELDEVDGDLLRIAERGVVADLELGRVALDGILDLGEQGLDGEGDERARRAGSARLRRPSPTPPGPG